MDIRTLGQLACEAKMALMAAERNLASLCRRETTVEHLDAAFEVCKSCYDGWLIAALAHKQAVCDQRVVIRPDGVSVGPAMPAAETARDSQGVASADLGWRGSSSPPPRGQIVKVEHEDGTFGLAVWQHVRDDQDPAYPLRDIWMSVGRSSATANWPVTLSLPHEIEVIRWRVLVADADESR